ncbi:MAG: hypothetical protein K1W30_07455 [Lachnospiraceae bacterium]
MTKNIIVIDEHGKKYGTTYPKRAKGLVKQGRARFQAQNVLCLMHCLACPPDQDLEDKNMSEQTIENKMMETETIERDTANGASANTGADTHAVGGQSKYTMEYCLEQIERIGRQTEYLNQAISELRQMEDSSGGEKAMALGNIVACRETTNQQMLRFYEKMYDDLKGKTVAADVITQKTHLQEQLLRSLDSAIETGIENGVFSSNEISDLFNKAFDVVR